MIDMQTETLYHLGPAAKFVPSLRPGKGTNPATLVRWITVGSRGVKLEALRLGGKWMTSREALQRFAERVTAATLGETPAPAPTPTALRRNAEKADRQLARMGF